MTIFKAEYSIKGSNDLTLVLIVNESSGMYGYTIGVGYTLMKISDGLYQNSDTCVLDATVEYQAMREKLFVIRRSLFTQLPFIGRVYASLIDDEQYRCVYTYGKQILVERLHVTEYVPLHSIQGYVDDGEVTV